MKFISYTFALSSIFASSVDACVDGTAKFPIVKADGSVAYKQCAW